MRQQSTKIVLHTEALQRAWFLGLCETAVEPDSRGHIHIDADHIDRYVPAKEYQAPERPRRKMVYDEVEGSIWVEINKEPFIHTHLTRENARTTPVTHVEDSSEGTGTIRVYPGNGRPDNGIQPLQKKIPGPPVTHVVDGDSGTIRVRMNAAAGPYIREDIFTESEGSDGPNAVAYHDEEYPD